MPVHPSVFETARYSKSSQPTRRHLFTNTHIQESVRAALDDDARIKHPELISVSVDEIGTVVLRGAVEALPERLAAKDDARHIEGVLDVIVDDLRVHPALAHRRPDDEIRAAAYQRLTSDPRIRSTHIHVKVLHGHLTLTGYVRQETERAAAAEDVASLSGLIKVTNRIAIR